MSTATVKGYTPAQMAPVNTHRPYHVRAVGLTFWSKAQIVMGCLLGIGSTLIGVCMVWALVAGVPQ